jgi:hypothetical protein
VGPTDRGWRRDSLYRGDGEGFLVNGKKAIGNLLEKVFCHFIPYMTILWYWGGDREAACDNPPRKIPYYRLRPIHFGH